MSDHRCIMPWAHTNAWALVSTTTPCGGLRLDDNAPLPLRPSTSPVLKIPITHHLCFKRTADAFNTTDGVGINPNESNSTNTDADLLNTYVTTAGRHRCRIGPPLCMVRAQLCQVTARPLRSRDSHVLRRVRPCFGRKGKLVSTSKPDVVSWIMLSRKWSSVRTLLA